MQAFGLNALVVVAAISIIATLVWSVVYVWTRAVRPFLVQQRDIAEARITEATVKAGTAASLGATAKELATTARELGATANGLNETAKSLGLTASVQRETAETQRRTTESMAAQINRMEGLRHHT